jgi:hypothetical protein
MVELKIPRKTHSNLYRITKQNLILIEANTVDFFPNSGKKNLIAAQLSETKNLLE